MGSLVQIAEQLVAPGKGILASDESVGEIGTSMWWLKGGDP